MGKYEFQVSVLDNAGAMNLLSYEFDYNQGEESIHYDGFLTVSLPFNTNVRYSEFSIDPEKVRGPVNSYQLHLPADSSCGFFSV